MDHGDPDLGDPEPHGIVGEHAGVKVPNHQGLTKLVLNSFPCLFWLLSSFENSLIKIKIKHVQKI